MSKQMTKKKVVIIKFVLILLLGLLTGISCIFARPIEHALGLSSEESGYVGEGVVFDDDLIIHYLDVGQGDSTLICLPDGTTMLIDASESKAASHIISYINNLGISQIDYFVLTHSDADHVGGAAAIYQEFEIKHSYRPFQIAVEDDSSTPYQAAEDEDLAVYLEEYEGSVNVIDTLAYRSYISAIYNETYTENGSVKQSTVTVNYDGLVIDSTKSGVEFTIEFFAPIIRDNTQIDTAKTDGYVTKYYGNKTAASKNNASPVMLLEYKEDSFVFTGDAQTKVEEDFLASLTPAEKERFTNVDVFQAGHHGSDTSNTEELLNLFKPDRVVVSAGKDNKYGHPKDEIVKRIDNLPHSCKDYLLITFKVGDITFGYVNGTLSYRAKASGEGSGVRWWHIALGIFVVGTIVILSVKITSNKEATVKRTVSKTKQVIKKLKNLDHKISFVKTTYCGAQSFV